METIEQADVLNEAMQKVAPEVQNSFGQRLMAHFCASFAARVHATLNERGYEIREKTRARKATTAAKKAVGTRTTAKHAERLAD
ncbi:MULTISPECIES: hypothetical protein [unclassified Micromonospora]|uniref:hypothetical protein n=1 Tax=unclassified Micromonospora TaxID=2617518 RepID=UPI002FF3A7B7